MPEIESAANFTAELFCPVCGYNLAAIDSARCPECGTAIDRSMLGHSILPWLHRRHLGRFRGFWRTVNLATFHPHKLATEMNCPTHLEDATQFRRLVVAHAVIPFGVALAIAWLNAVDRDGFWVSTDKLGSILQMASLPVGWLCLAIFFWGMTGAASYFFHPAALSTVRQNRAIALSFYASAPLAWLPLAWLLAFFALVASGNLAPGDAPILMIVAFSVIGLGLVLISVLLLLRVPVAMLKHATHCGAGRQVVMGFLLPIIWIFWGVLSLLALPAIWLALVVMAVSLWS